jgi:hypothetical protein
MRDDSILYSGLTSASSRKIAETKVGKKDEKVTKRTEIKPIAIPVFNEIQKQKDMLGEILLAIVDPDSPDEKVASQLEAVRLHRAWLINFEGALKNVLREPKEKSDE